MGNSASEQITISVRGFKRLSQHSDITLYCGQHKWEVHRIILSMWSRYFEKACERNPHVINLKGHNPEIVDRMIDYLYTYDYSTTSSTAGPLEINARVYQMADKYEILSLKDAALLKSRMALSSVPKPESGGSESADFAAALEIVWTTTPKHDRGLRDQFLRWIGDHQKAILSNDSYTAIIGDYPDLAIDVIQELSRRLNDGESSCTVPGCNGSQPVVPSLKCTHSTPSVPPKWTRAWALDSEAPDIFGSDSPKPNEEVIDTRIREG